MRDAFDIATDLRRDIDWKALMPRYNIAPTDQIPVIFEKGGQRRVEPMRWGLIPFRTASMRGRSTLDEMGKSINTPINARAETVHSHGSFKRSFEKRRCLIPAGGFYEWKKEGNRKQPHWIGQTDRGLMAFAGLWESWKENDENVIESFTIITTEPNEKIRALHNRMPVILDRGAYADWLNPERSVDEPLLRLLRPCPADIMEAYPVSTRVNSPKNDHPSCVEHWEK